MIRDQIRLDKLIGTVRAFVRDVAIPNEARVESNEAIPPEIVASMRELGFFGWSIPQEYGGSGLTTEELAIANMEISQCTVAYRDAARDRDPHRKCYSDRRGFAGRSRPHRSGWSGARLPQRCANGENDSGRNCALARACQGHRP